MNVRRADLILLLMVLAGQAGGGLSSAGKAQDLESYRIAVDVDLVVLHPAVRDRKGRFVSDLREQDFEIYEDGVRQTIRLFECSRLASGKESTLGRGDLVESPCASRWSSPF